MSVMRHSRVLLLVFSFCSAIAAPPVALPDSPCGIRLGQRHVDIPRVLKQEDVGPLIFRNAAGSGSIEGRRVEIKSSASCEGVMSERDVDPDKAAPDVIAAVFKGRVVSISFRPIEQNRAAIERAISSRFGPPGSAHSELSEWTDKRSNTRILLTCYSDDFCWFTQQRFGVEQEAR